VAVEGFVPFWESDMMEGESILLLPHEGGSAEGTLLFEPERVVRVTNAAGDSVYEENRDYVVDAVRRRIVRTSRSRMPEATAASDGSLTHAELSLVTYTHSERWTVESPRFEGERLKRTIGRLCRRDTITIAVTGDSISEGYDSSGFHRIPPERPPYAPLVADALARRYRAPLRLHNLATAGWTAADGLYDIDRIVSYEPDLVIIAYGMNDASYAEAEEFVENIRGIVAAVRLRLAGAEFLLVSPMLPAPACTWVRLDRFDQYRRRLLNLAQEGIAVADVTAAWRFLIDRKDPRELCGNGLNHPNDFGHRVYAEVITAAIEGGGTGRRSSCRADR
jgi:lysophospholipase L1-like esterase